MAYSLDDLRPKDQAGPPLSKYSVNDLRPKDQAAASSVRASGQFTLDDVKPKASLSGFGSALTKVVSPTGIASAVIDALRGRGAFTDEEKESVKAYGPTAAVIGGSFLLPGASIPMMIGTNLAGSAAIRGARAGFSGESVPAAMNPLTHLGETALDVAAPVVLPPVVRAGAAGISKLIEKLGPKATSPSPVSVPTSIIQKLGLERRAPLPEVDPTAGATPGQVSEALDSMKAWLVPAITRAERSTDDPAAMALGEALRRTTERTRRIEHYGLPQAVEVFGDLAPEQRQALRLALRSQDLTALPPGLAERATRLQGLLEEGFDLLEAGSVMQRRGGSQIPVQRKEGFFPARFAFQDRTVPEAIQELIDRSGGKLSWDDAMAQVLEQRRVATRQRIASAPSATPFEQQTSKLTAKQQAMLEEAGKYPEELDPLEAATMYWKDVARQFALAEAGGGGELEQGIGKGFVNLLQGVKDPTTRAALEQQVRNIYKRPQSGLDRGVSKFNRAVGHMLLPHAWSLQPSQLAAPIAHFGGKNALKGAFGSDDALREVATISGAGDSGYAGMLDEMFDTGAAAGKPETLPMQAMSGIERAMRRKVAAPAAFLRAQEIGTQAAAGLRTPALAREAAELGTTLDELAEAVTAGGGKIDLGTHRSLAADVMQRGADRTMLQTAGGHMPAALDDWPGKMLLYKKFGVGQSNMVLDDYLRPLMTSGERGLGAKRLAKHFVASAALGVPVHLTRSLLRGRMPGVGAYVNDTVGSAFGIGGDAIGAAAESLIGGDRSRNPVEVLAGQHPLLSIAERALDQGTDAMADFRHGEPGAGALTITEQVTRLAPLILSMRERDPMGFAAMVAPIAAALQKTARMQIDEPNREKKQEGFRGF